MNSPTRLLKLLISFLVYLTDIIIRQIRNSLGILSAGTCIVLLYHGVTAHNRSRFCRQMDDLLRLAQPIPLENSEAMEKGRHYAAITFDDGYLSDIENALPELEKRSIPAAFFISPGCVGHYPNWLGHAYQRLRHEPIMTAEQARVLGANRMVSIGSHGMHHLNLASLSESEAFVELVDSRLELEKLLVRKIRMFSFPFGVFTDRLVELSRQAGYERVFTVRPTLAFADPHEYVTGRVDVDPTDWHIEFRLKLLGAYRWLPLASTLKQRVRRAGSWLRRNSMRAEKLGM